MTDTPRLSVCMIARDEAEILGQAIDSVRELADEIVLIDTGSSDGTVELAESLGAHVGSMPWANDFSLARNASLAAASGDWLLILDADEVLSAEDHGSVRELMRGRRDIGYLFEQRNYTDRSDVLDWVPNDRRFPPAARYGGFVRAWQLRLVPNHPRLRYRGAVHEEMDPSLREAGFALEHRPVIVHHYGKVRAAAVMARKQQLYTRLGQLKLEADPESPRALYEMGVQYAEVGDREQARAALERCLALGGEPWFRGRATAMLGQIAIAQGRLGDAVTLLEGGVRAHPTLMSIWHTLAHALALSQQRSRAILVLEQALQIFPENVTLRGYLGLLYLELRQWDVARECFDRVRRSFPQSPAARTGLACAALLQEGEAALPRVASLLDEAAGAQREAVVAALRQEGQHALALLVALDAGPMERRERPLLLQECALAARDGFVSAATACARGIGGLSAAEQAQAVARALAPGTLGWGLELLEQSQADRPAGLAAVRAGLLAKLGCPALGAAQLERWKGEPAVAALLRRLQSQPVGIGALLPADPATS